MVKVRHQVSPHLVGQKGHGQSVTHLVGQKGHGHTHLHVDKIEKKRKSQHLQSSGRVAGGQEEVLSLVELAEEHGDVTRQEVAVLCVLKVHTVTQ